MSNKEFLKHIGMEIRIARIRKGLHQKQVAEMTGLHANCISDVENGTHAGTILSYKRITDVLELRLSDLFIFAG